MHKEIVTKDRLASEPTPTIRERDEYLRRREQERAEEDAINAQRFRERDPAVMPKIFVPNKLIFEVFIGHDDIFTAHDDYDPKTTDANEAWLRAQTFLLNTEYLVLLIEHTKAAANKIPVNDVVIFPVENLAPYRPNVLLPLITTAGEVLLDHDEWSKKRVKENGERAIELPTSKYRYGYVLADRIGIEAYEQICAFYLESVQEMARRKQIGGFIQQVEGKLPNQVSPTILTQLTEFGDTFEDAVAAYCKSLKEQSIIPRPYYAFMYKVGALVMSIIDPNHETPGLPLSRDTEKLAADCLMAIAEAR